MTAVVLALSLTLSVPPLVDGPYPRAFFFRAAEGAARNPRTVYEDWSRDYSRLGGIMGKVLDEEIPNTSGRNIEFFRRFKADHPDQAVFLHYNGNSRDPRAADGFFPSHWLYFCGPILTADLPADANATTLAVADTSPFRVNGGRYGTSNDDLMVARLVDGRIDWAHSEQLQLVSIDATAKTITVNRGCYGTEPLAFTAGQAVVQIHCTEGPWGKNSNLLWYYNWREDGPRDPAGRTCPDVFFREFSTRFGPGGDLAYFDGVEFDVLGWDRGMRRGGYGLDSDGDNVGDQAVVAETNRYALGVYRLGERLRAALPEKLWMADGWHVDHNQRAVGALNGIESEGWPTLADGECEDWSGGLNRHRYNARFAAAPRFSYVNHKHNEAGDLQVPVDANITRLVEAAAVLMDSGFCYSLRPPGPGPALPIWDELVAGVDHQPGWLGQPEETPRLLAKASPDLLAGAGRSPTLTADGPTLRQRIATLDLPGGDLTILGRFATQPIAGMPAGVPRVVWVSVVCPGDLLGPDFTAGMRVRGQEPAAIDPASGATVLLRPSEKIGDEAHRAIFIHPPWRGAPGVAGEAWFERQVAVPPRATLRFLTGLRPAPNPSDGVTFSVSVLPADGQPVEVFREHRAQLAWLPGEVDLSRWAGQTVTLRFSSDCGTAGNSTCDHSLWAEVELEAGGQPRWDYGPFTPRRLMTWAGPEPFEAGFTFRSVGPGPGELWLEAEGDGPLTVTDLTAHAAADVQTRRFQHGLVLANPSLAPQTIDLDAVGGGRRYRRLQGTEHQDPVLNDGRPCGASEIVPPRDALFLRRVE